MTKEQWISILANNDIPLVLDPVHVKDLLAALREPEAKTCEGCVYAYLGGYMCRGSEFNAQCRRYGEDNRPDNFREKT